MALLVGARRGNCCITGARNYGPGTILGQIGTIEIAAGGVLRERSFPELLWRPEVPISTAPQRELPLADPMSKFDAGQGDGRTPEGLEAAHPGASAFDCSMIPTLSYPLRRAALRHQSRESLQAVTS